MSANPNVPEDEKKWIEDTVDLIHKSKAKGLTCGDMMSLELENKAKRNSYAFDGLNSNRLF